MLNQSDFKGTASLYMSGALLNRIQSLFVDLTYYLQYFREWLYEIGEIGEDDMDVITTTEDKHPNAAIEWFRTQVPILRRIPKKEIAVTKYITKHLRFGKEYCNWSKQLHDAYLHVTHDGLARFRPSKQKNSSIPFTQHSHDAREAMSSFFSISHNIARELQKGYQSGATLEEPDPKLFKRNVSKATKVFNSYIAVQAQFLGKKIKVIRSGQILKTHGFQFLDQLMSPNALKPVVSYEPASGKSSSQYEISNKYETFSSVESVLDFDTYMYILIVEPKELVLLSGVDEVAGAIPVCHIFVKITDPALFEVTMSNRGPGRSAGAHGEHSDGEEVLQNMPLDATMSIWTYSLADLYGFNVCYDEYRKIIVTKNTPMQKYNKFAELFEERMSKIGGWMKVYYYGEEVMRLHPYISPNCSSRCTGGFNEIDASTHKFNLVSGMRFVKQWLSKYIQGHTNPQNNIDWFIVGYPNWLTERYSEINGHIGSWEECRTYFQTHKGSITRNVFNNQLHSLLNVVGLGKANSMIIKRLKNFGVAPDLLYKNIDAVTYKSFNNLTKRMEKVHCSACNFSNDCPKFSKFIEQDTSYGLYQLKARRAARNKSALPAWMPDSIIQTFKDFTEAIFKEDSLPEELKNRLESARIFVDASYNQIPLSNAHSVPITTVEFMLIMYDELLPRGKKYFANYFASETYRYRHEYRFNGLKTRLRDKVLHVQNIDESSLKRYKSEAKTAREAAGASTLEQANKLHYKFGVGYWFGQIPPKVINNDLYQQTQRIIAQLNGDKSEDIDEEVVEEEVVEESRTFTAGTISSTVIDAILNATPVTPVVDSSWEI